MTPTNDTVDAWLASIGKDRPWLAEQIGISLGTLYNQFSHGFTKRTLKELARLMNPLGNKASGLELTFTHDEFMEITEAMRIAGYSRHADFYHDAIVERATDINATAKKSKIIALPVSPTMIETLVADGTTNSAPLPQAPTNYKHAIRRAKHAANED